LGEGAEDGARQDIPAAIEDDSNVRWPILAASGQEMLAKLKEVDPVMAERWHPNDVRKIRRSLEIWLKTGRKASEVYAEQETARAGTGPGVAKAKQPGRMDDANREDTPPMFPESIREGLLRFSTILFWPHVPRQVLAPRLDARVDNMIQSGLLDEAMSLHISSKLATQDNLAIDETRGIYTAVGYKEFKPYLTASSSSDQEIIEGMTDSTSLLHLLNDSVELTKGATRRYAKSQIRWVRIKLVHALQQANFLASSPPAVQSAVSDIATDTAPITTTTPSTTHVSDSSVMDSTSADRGASILDALATLDAEEGNAAAQGIDFGDWDDDIIDDDEHKKKEALASEREVARLRDVAWVGEKPALDKASARYIIPSNVNPSQLYILDASDPSPPSWASHVLGPASRYLTAFLSNTPTSSLPDPGEEAAAAGAEYEAALKPLRDDDLGRSVSKWKVKTCEICGISAVREEEWKRHLGSGRHKRSIKGKEKREAFAKRQAEIGEQALGR
jgi:tRNA A37 N6-isopentenylltransferase MiaA